MTNDRVAGGSHTTQEDVFAILLVATLGLVLRILFCNGLLGGDDTNYLIASKQILFDHHLSTVHHHSSRLILLVLVGLPGALLGDIYASSLINIVYSLVTDLTVTAVVYSMLGSRAALLCAVVLMLNGVLMSYSGTLLPEPLLTLFAFLAVWTFQKAINEEGKAGLRLAACAGVLCGLSYSAKDTGILVGPLLVAYLTLFHLRQFGIQRVFLQSACCFAGFATTVLLECSALWLLSGDFAYKYHAISLTHNGQVEAANGLVDFIRRGWWNLSQVFQEPLALGVPAVAFLAAWISCLVRHSAVRIYAFVGLGLSIYLVFGTSSFTRLVNLPFQERYATLILPFGAICLAACTRALLTRERRGTYATALIAVVCLWAGLVVSAERAGTLYHTESLRNAVAAASSVPEEHGRIATPAFLCLQLRSTTPAILADRLECLPKEALRVPDGLQALLLPSGGAMQSVDVISRSGKPPENEGWVLYSVHHASQKNIDRLLGVGAKVGIAGANLYIRQQSPDHPD